MAFRFRWASLDTISPRTMSSVLSSDREDNEPDIHLGPAHDRRSTSHLRNRKSTRIKDRTRQPSAGAFWIGQAPPVAATTMDLESAQEPNRPVHIIEDTPEGGSPATVTPVDERADGEVNGEVFARKSADSDGSENEIPALN